MKLSNSQRKYINGIKDCTADTVGEALKIKDLSPIEETILKGILKQLRKRTTTPFDQRRQDCIEDYLTACGVIYNHLSEKTINYGAAYTQPKYITVTTVNTDGIITGQVHDTNPNNPVYPNQY